MAKWLFAALLVLQAYFAASYLVPLDREAQARFGGLLRGDWPWSIGDGGLLGRITTSGFPVAGFFLAVAMAGVVYPSCAGSDGVVGSVRLVEGVSYSRSYPLARPDGVLLRSHKAGADGP